MDTVKGLLIILVIFAHITSNGPTTQHFGYLIGSFFMQLFFGISGYLLTQRSIRKPFKDLVTKYWYRLLMPFLFAYVIYTLIEQQWLDLFYPYTWFHLWFIVAFLIMIAFVSVLEKFNINRTLVLIAAAIFSFLWIGLYGTNGTIDIYRWMGHKAVYYDFVFFYLGYYLRNHLVLSNKNYLFLLALLIFSAVYILVFNNTIKINFEYSLIWLFFNLSMIYLVLLSALKYPTIKLPLVTWMGAMSLPIYLLHIVPLLLLKPFVGSGTLSPYLHIILYFTGVLIIMMTIYLTRNTKFGKMLILGERIEISETKK